MNKLLGKTLNLVEQDGDSILFHCSTGERYRLESGETGYGNDVSVWIEDITGDLNDLVGSIILASYEETETSETDTSETWSFYVIRTIKGTVTIRFYGTSNGYYSETAYLEEVKL